MAESSDPFLKLARAHDHLIRLETEIKGWLSSDPQTITSEPDLQRPGQTAYYIEPIESPVLFSLLVGDCLQNMRSGLDHVAYALAAANTVPLPADFAQESEFPIFGDIDRHGRLGTGAGRFAYTRAGGGLRKIRGVDPRAQALIEGLQPYHRGQDFASDPLWKLHELARIDKHRLVHVVVAWFSGAAFGPATSRNWRIGPGVIVTGSGTAQGRSFLASFPVWPADPSEDVYLDVKAPLDIAFGDATPIVGREPVVKAVAEIYNYIVGTVLPPLGPFLSQMPALDRDVVDSEDGERR